MISPRHLEGIARELLEGCGISSPVDIRLLAHRCGLELRPWGKSYGQLTTDGVIRYPLKVRETRQAFTIAHEISHWAIARAGEDDRDEAAADYLAGALMLPRETFLRDLAETDWALDALQLRHPHASAQGIVVRMTQVSPATASVWDHGRLHRVYGEHDIEEARRLVDLALELEEPIEVGPARAWPVLDGAWRRVLVVRRAA